MAFQRIGTERHVLITGIKVPKGNCSECGQNIPTQENPRGGDGRVFKEHNVPSYNVGCAGSLKKSN